jgi:hypothetical protein
MPTPVAHVGAVAQCPHGGSVTFVPSGPRVFVSGSAVATTGDTDQVAGCGFNVSGSPHPCLTVKWLVPAQRVKSNLLPLILKTSGGICLAGDQAPQGPPVVNSTQTRVSAT